jgi:hypothetical protein
MCPNRFIELSTKRDITMKLKLFLLIIVIVGVQNFEPLQAQLNYQNKEI